MKKVLFIICSFLIFTFNVNAFELSSKNVVLYNMNDNTIVYELNKDKTTSIASLTKIMTTLVAIENISNYDEKITINNNMFIGLREANAAVIGLKNMQIVTYNDLLYGMFLSSGADATRAIAISIAGNEESFVELMNKKAKEIGMLNTHFENTVGLDNINHYSTVNDVALMLKYALNNSKFKEIFLSESYSFSDNSLTVYSTTRKTAHKYNYNINYIEGAKTGYTDAAGKCLASLAYDNVNNIEYLLVTTGASTNTNDAYHIKDATSIYSYYFENYKYYNLVNMGDIILRLPIKYGKEEMLNIYASNDIKIYYDKSFNKENIDIKYNGIDELNPSMKENTKLGEIEILYDNEVVDKFDIFLTKKIDFSLYKFVIGNYLYITIGIVIILIIIKFIKR